MPYETALRVNDDSVTYTTACLKQQSDGDSLLTKIIESRKRTDAFSILAIQTLIELCLEDDIIARYVYDVMPPIFAQAHFYDFIEEFLEN